MIEKDLADGVIVVHGTPSCSVAQDSHDGEPRSSLDSSLPLEATVPTPCGERQRLEDETNDGLLEGLL